MSVRSCRGGSPFLCSIGVPSGLVQKKGTKEKYSLHKRALWPSSHKRRPLSCRRAYAFYRFFCIIQNPTNKPSVTSRYRHRAVRVALSKPQQNLFIELDAAAGFFAYFFCSIGVPLGPAEKKYVPAA